MTPEELANRFDFHPATDLTGPIHAQVRVVCHDAAKIIVGLTGGPTREQSLAITALEEAMMWANAAIARYPQ